MPLSSFRTWVGGSMDRINGQTSAAITTTSSQAVALSNVVGSIATTGYAFIIDGPNTEVLAYTTGSSSGTTGTITVTPTLTHNANTYVAIQATNSPAFYLPLEKIAPADEYAQLLDQSYQGSSVKTYAAIQGMRTSTWDISGAVFADTFGYLVGGIFGAEDYTAGTPSQHAFGVDNTTEPAAHPGHAVVLRRAQHSGLRRRQIHRPDPHARPRCAHGVHGEVHGSCFRRLRRLRSYRFGVNPQAACSMDREPHRCRHRSRPSAVV